MTEYDQLCKMLNVKFKSSSQDEMNESKGDKKSQTVKICWNGSNLETTLYDTDLDVMDQNGEDFLPFFNKINGLRRFCDYILLAKSEKRGTVVLLIELKRGETKDAPKQLNASQTFMEYIYSSAERLHVDFNDSEFDKNKVTTMKIVVRKPISKKMPTKGRLNIKKENDVYYFKTNEIFPIKKIIEEHF